ncbi:MAG: cyclic nucleotide-binding domain-containing protein, partial [Saccharofermentans sp.]|nr:cyclic nucleotide-binding domain-containing protein [Saccharofermentans sp.]
MSIVEKTFRNGEMIIKEGESGNSFFQLVSGSAYVYAGFGKNDQIKLGTIEAGEYFGEMSILEEYPRSATIIASGNVSVLEITKDGLKDYFAEDPDRIIQLMQFLGNRVWTMNRDYVEAQGLLKELREADEKKPSLFSKIKKHIDMYQNNKSKMEELPPENLAEDLAALGNAGKGKSK